jgi:hypothetical protein
MIDTLPDETQEAFGRLQALPSRWASSNFAVGAIEGRGKSLGKYRIHARVRVIEISEIKG